MSKAKSRRASENDWPNPTRPSDKEIKSLIKKHALPEVSFRRIRLFVDRLALVAAVQLSEGRRPSAGETRRDLLRQVRVLEDVIEALTRLNFGQEMLPWSVQFSLSTAQQLGPILSPQFVQQFTEYEDTRRALGVLDADLRQPLAKAIREMPTALVMSVLAAIKNILAETASASKMTGGDVGYVVGRFLLLNFAIVFEEVAGDRHPSQDPNGPFGRFAKDLLRAMGLESDWVDGQLRRAIPEWRAGAL